MDANFKSLYTQIGEQKLKSLVNHFNDVIEQEPEGKLLHKLHLEGHGIAHARVELERFLTGFLGGPGLYLERWGHTSIRKIHEHVDVTEEAQKDWIICMRIALSRMDLDADLIQKLLSHFEKVAKNLINK